MHILEVIGMQADEQLRGRSQTVAGNQPRQRLDVLVIGGKADETGRVGDQLALQVEIVQPEILIARDLPGFAEITVIRGDAADVDPPRGEIVAQGQFLLLKV